MIPPSTIQKAAEAIEATGETTRQGAEAAAQAAFDAIGLAELLEAAEPFRSAAANVPAEVEGFKIVAHVPGGHNAESFRKMSGHLTADNFRRLSTAIAKIGAG